MKIAKLVGIGVLAVVALVLLVLFVGIDATGLGNVALDRLGVSGGMEAQLENARFSLRDGLSLRGIDAAASTESGEMEGRIEAVDLDVAWLPLLGGEVRIRSLDLESPRFDVVLAGAAADGGASEEELADAAAPVMLTLQSAAIHDGTIEVEVRGPTDSHTRLEGVNLELTDVVLDPRIAPPLLGATGSGRLTVGGGEVAGLELLGAEGSAALANGSMTFVDVVATIAGGTLRVPRLVVDLTAAPARYEMELVAEALDLNVLAGYQGVDALGPADLDARLRGSADGEVTGEGTLRLAAGGLPPSPSLDALDALLGSNLAAARYAPAEIHFVPGPDGVRVEPFEFTSEAARLRGSGTLLHGTDVDFTLAVALPRSQVRTNNFADVVLEALTDEQGWVVFPVHVGGTVLEPAYGVDSEALRDLAASRARRAVEDEVERRVRGILEGVCCR